MLSPEIVYPLLLAWVEALGAVPHATARAALAHRLSAVLLGQSLAPASLMRALLSPERVPARHRYQRVARTWHGRWLTSAWLTPVLVRAVRALTGETAPVRALDSVRCGRWEVFTVGLVWHRRVLLVGWEVLPYPWPKGRFTPTVCALLARVDAAWPADAPRPHLVADRGFPSRPLFALLRRQGWQFPVRLRATDRVWVNGQGQPVRQLLRAACQDGWSRQAAVYGGRAMGTHAQVVIGRGLVVLPHHQRDAGSARTQARRQARRQHDLHLKHPRQKPDASAPTDAWVVLFTTAPTLLAAVRTYRQRWSIEGTYRDGQSGWDGRHGWDLEPTLARQRQPGVVAQMVGLWALALLVQCWVGDQVGRPDAAPAAVAACRAWTTTGRLSVWARGRFALLDHSGVLRTWLPATLTAGAARLAAAPPLPARHRPPAA